jgi:hypothetical protein
MLASEQILTSAPWGSVTYRLLVKLWDGASRLYPAEPGTFFRIGDPSTNVPIGKYSIYYYDCGNQLIRCLEDGLVLDETAAALPPSQPKATPEPIDTPPSESELELRRHMQAMDLEERQQEFIKGSTYITELGEVFTLNRLMRREMLEMHRIIVSHSQRAYQDIDQVKGTIHELLSLQKAVLEHAATQIARPPSPPPDYVGLGHSALAMVKELGVALIQRSAMKEAGVALGARDSARQLPAALSSDAAKAAEISGAPNGQSAGAVSVARSRSDPAP